MWNISPFPKTTPLIVDHQDSLPRAVQIAPNHRHASSNYRYHSELLEPYGVSEEDWLIFTSQFVNANRLSRNELIGIAAVSIILQGTFIFVLGPPGFPLGAIISGGITTGPIFYALKGRRLRRHVHNRDIPNWLAMWNAQYFNPKGLVVGFNLPGRRLEHAVVAPKPRKTMINGDGYRKPKSQRSVARRPRIVIIPLHDPVAGAGSVPLVAPIRISQLHRREYPHGRDHLHLLRMVLIRYTDLDKLKRIMKPSRKLTARLEKKRLMIEQLRAQRLDLVARRLSPAQPDMHIVTSPSHQEAPQVQSEGRRPHDELGPTPAAFSLDGTGHEPSLGHQGLNKLRIAFRKRSKGERLMLGSSRVTDASQRVL